MNTEDFLSCDVCKELFNGVNRMPRMLECGHSFCSICLSSIILQARDARCPICQGSIRYISIYEIPVNYNLKQLAENFEIDQKGDVTPLAFGKFVETVPQTSTQGKCFNDSSRNQFFCSTCNVSLCINCVRSNHVKCKIIPISFVLDPKRTQCDAKIVALSRDCFVEGMKLKKLNDEVLNNLQVYLNLAEEQEKDLRATRDVVHSLNANLSQISLLDDQIKSKTKFYNSEKLTNSTDTSYNAVVNREIQFETEDDSIKILSLDIKDCEASIKRDLENCEHLFSDQNTSNSSNTSSTGAVQRKFGKLLKFSIRKKSSNQVLSDRAANLDKETENKKLKSPQLTFAQEQSKFNETGSSVIYPMLSRPHSEPIPSFSQGKIDMEWQNGEDIDKLLAKIDSAIMENKKS